MMPAVLKHFWRGACVALLLSGVLRAAIPDDLARLSRGYIETGKPQDRAELLAYIQKTPSADARALGQFALGMGDYRAGAFAQSAAALEQAEGVKELLDYVRYYRARALAGAEDFAKAAELASGFPQKFPQSLLAGDSLRLRAESLIRMGETAAALQLLEASQKALSEPVRLFLLARTQMLSGELKAAVSAYRQVYYKYPFSDQAAPAEEALNDLRRRLAAEYPGAPAAWRFERADALFARGQYTEARAEYLQVSAALKGADRDHARVRIGVCDYRRSRSNEAFLWLSKLDVSDIKADAERLYYLGQCARRKNLIDRFTEIAEELGRKYPQSPWYEEALFSLGNYNLLENDGRKYREYYERVVETFPKGRYADVAHWKVCWRAYLDGDPRSALLMQDHLERYPNSSNRSAALYWLGRLAERDGDLSRAHAIYSALTKHFPLYYYSFRAAERLSEIKTPVVVAGAVDGIPFLRSLPGLPPVADKASAATARLLTRGRLLFQLGLDDLAERELRAGDHRGADSHLLGLELAAQKVDRREFHRALRYMKLYAQGYLRLPLDTMAREFWESLFPMPFSEDLRSNASRQDLDPYLVAALIRQESEFDPAARSRAGARGLMQIMPATGRLLARKAGVRPFSSGKLYVPELSLQLGTLHLRDVLNQFENSLEYTLAAYNAGEHRVVEWVTWGNFEEPGTFVETIPFTETREYVQSVLRNMAVYRALYGEPPGLTTPSRAALGADGGASAR
jgi:soluble lytic murein transglycosylase